ncbi:hypothetical protein [Candidatus Enterococcus leclercqii]|uniref:hypothetical protein n=1 Tax=Enterococcus TaxID=1350 RepID=UPI001379E0E5|nr:hypothetical protein [Enterococcus sp. CU9D]KAF1293022.1 hypothetical protein BAU14_09465 [Enterococcus sp. CU9D]
MDDFDSFVGWNHFMEDEEQKEASLAADNAETDEEDSEGEVKAELDENELWEDAEDSFSNEEDQEW